ncbi:MAG: hypothetical protein A3C55_03945 [Gammaproteobacteria bacterium RIFCSPHIGHO2_02_FULL_42_13]|nr:MAG: hypothetical protein A3C55_03945 [Gammaproteobacteria bacterium RIFCSPHIGHO2_02_FULL_42_13]OGT67933.1 MAG: hypothetical protein A3H43_02425 [Gammaproteobacteria bacterium RIFCSPLOWO2_02_FULL_42_9]
MKELQSALQPVIKDAIEAGRIVGTSIIVAKDGDIVFEQHAGFADCETKQPVTEQTIFRLASMTKPLVSTAAMVLVEKRLLDLDAPVTRWLPEFTPKFDSIDAPITVRQLMTHTSGLSYGFLSPDNEPYFSAGVSDGMDEKVLSLDENLKRLTTVSLFFKPGTNWCYSLSTDVLGAVIEKVCQKPLPEIIAQYVTEPLDMRDTTFHVKDVHRLAKAYTDPITPGGIARLMQAQDQVVLEGCGPIHYAPGRITNSKAYPSGGSGMAGTARNYIKFLEMIRKGGVPLLQSASVKLLTEDAVKGFEVPAAGPGFGFGFGFAVVRDSKTAETPQHPGSFEWGGVYGCKMFVDPVAGLSVVILTNTALYGLMKFPIKVRNAIYEGLKLHESSVSSAAHWAKK